MGKKGIAALCAVVLALSGCVGPSVAHVVAERATFDWFAPLTRGYIMQDALLPEADKATHLRGIEAWEARIKADEAAVGVGR